MRRREVFWAFWRGWLAFPLGARAQEPGRTFRIGMAEPVSAELNAAYLAAFRQELKRLGYVEGVTSLSSTDRPTATLAGSRRYSPN